MRSAARGLRPAPSPAAARRRRWLQEEREAAAVYRALAARRESDQHDILLALAEAEERHAAHWEGLLGAQPAASRVSGLRARVVLWLARHVGILLVLSLVQRAELRGDYEAESEATPAMAADEQVHARVVATLAQALRERVSGPFRAAVFGVTDGLVSNLSLVLGLAGAGTSSATLLLAGLAGLLAGALSMGAGEYVSVRSQRELLESGAGLDVEALTALRRDGEHELALVFRAEGAGLAEAERRSAALLAGAPLPPVDGQTPGPDVVGSALAAAAASFAAFALGAGLPVVPFAVLSGGAALIVAVLVTGAALFVVGGAAGVLTGGPLARRGLRQLAIGALAAAATYALGSLAGVAVA